MSYTGRDASLVIKDTELSDAGRYRCEADNRVARVQTEATLTVQSKFLMCMFDIRYPLLFCEVRFMRCIAEVHNVNLYNALQLSIFLCFKFSSFYTVCRFFFYMLFVGLDGKCMRS